MTTTVVLVHGGYHGGWCWRRVASRLRPQGFDVYAPSLTGCGDRAHLLSPTLTQADRVQDIVGLIESEELQDVILCGHSAGGVTITGVAERIPERIKHLVYLDAIVPQDGQSLFGFLGEANGLHATALRKAAETGAGWRLDVTATALHFGVTDEADQAWVERRMTPESLRIWQEPISIGDGYEQVKNKTYVWATQFDYDWNKAAYQRFSADGAWNAIQWDEGHNVMIVAPEKVAQLLVSLAG